LYLQGPVSNKPGDTVADETGGIVIDVGCATGKFGFAGDEVPKAVFDTVRFRSS
jgi:actin-related protein